MGTLAKRGIKESVELKAARIVHEGRIEELAGARAFFVRGATGEYHVIVAPGWAKCSCPELKARCSHLMAARALIAMIAGALP